MCVWVAVLHLLPHSTTGLVLKLLCLPHWLGFLFQPLPAFKNLKSPPAQFWAALILRVHHSGAVYPQVKISWTSQAPQQDPLFQMLFVLQANCTELYCRQFAQQPHRNLS